MSGEVPIPRRVAMIGATGLVGAALAGRLLGEPEGPVVEALLRRPSGRTHKRWREQVLAMAEWPAAAAGLDVDAAVSALGTTMRAAGSQAAFAAVDLDTVVAFARAAREAGARRMLTISSVGADPGSSNFYLRIKGEMEQALGAMGFDRLDIFRPGLLRGPRGGERRLGERVGIAVSPLVNLVLRGRLDRFAAIEADRVAAAMAACLKRCEPGTFVHHNREIGRLARA